MEWSVKNDPSPSLCGMYELPLYGVVGAVWGGATYVGAGLLISGKRDIRTDEINREVTSASGMLPGLSYR